MRSSAAERVDPGLKLFGRRIPVEESKMRAAPGEDSKQILRCQEHQVQNNVSEEEDTPSSQLDDLGSSSGSCEDEKVESAAKQPREVLNNVSNVVGAGKKGGKEQQSCVTVGTRTTVQQEQQRTGGGQAHEQQQQQEQQCQQQQQTEKPVLKRPDKLVPCPRCNSMETKFCYFNNYNVNQPRHFCKNCQRYWTAGGTLRNVPVGAGRRKSKHNSGGGGCGGGGGGGGVCHQEPLKNEQLKHQQTMNKVAARMRLPPILPQEICPFTPPETSPSGSMLTSLNSSPGSINSTIFNMHLAAAAAAAVASSQAPGEASVNVSPVGNPKNTWPDAPTRTTTTTGESAKECSLGQGEIKEVASKECSGCSAAGGPTLFNGAPAPAWPFFPWHNFLPAGPECNSDGPTAAANKSSNNNVNNQGNNNSGDMASLLSSFWAAGMPAWAPFAAASLWGPSAAGASGWNLPWSAAAAAAAAAAFAAAATAPISSKSLGKHPRDKLECGRIDGCLWAPKTLRIDDPGEAAKSSIWATLGLDKAPAPPTGGGVRSSPSGLCKPLHSKGGFEGKGGQSQKVHANPAALSRSMNFQENG